jgi:hypothetical protein
MQMVAWSPKVHASVKTLKQLDSSSLHARLNDRTFMDSLGLSAQEEKALKDSFLRKNSTNTDAEWA